ATMGFALPAAIAAQLVCPEQRVVCFTGDGGFMMVVAELETAVRLRLPITVIAFNDEALSLIEIKQEQKGYAGASMGYAGPEQAVKTQFEKLSTPVTLTVFASELGPENNAQAVSLIKEVAALSDKITVKVLNPHIERDEAAAYGVSVTPVVVVEGAKDYGIRF